MNEMKWEELKTPEAVMAAFEAGRTVKCSKYGVSTAASDEFTCAEVEGFMSDGWSYRALIEDAPPIPDGFKPWAGGECPEEAREKKTTVIFRDLDTSTSPSEDFAWEHHGRPYDIIAYRVEQPERQGEAVPEGMGLLVDALEGAMIESLHGEGFDLWAKNRGKLRNRLPENIGAIIVKMRALLAAAPQPIPVESLGRDADDGVEALAEQIAELIEQHHPEFVDYMPCARVIARRLRAREQYGEHVRTGVKDKNGLEIFAGDRIVYRNESERTKCEYWNPEYVVEWRAPSFILRHVGGGLSVSSASFAFNVAERDRSWGNQLEIIASALTTSPEADNGK